MSMAWLLLLGIIKYLNVTFFVMGEIVEKQLEYKFNLQVLIEKMHFKSAAKIASGLITKFYHEFLCSNFCCARHSVVLA